MRYSKTQTAAAGLHAMADACASFEPETGAYQGAAPWHGLGARGVADEPSALPPEYRQVTRAEVNARNDQTTDEDGFAFDDPEDVQRLSAICERANYFYTPRAVHAAWCAYSESVFAGWIGIPEDDDKALSMILPFLPA